MRWSRSVLGLSFELPGNNDGRAAFGAFVALGRIVLGGGVPLRLRAESRS
jgi:hypothetical protein